MEFLTSLPAKKAQEKLLSFPFSYRKEKVKIDEALGRISWDDIISPNDLPPFSRSLVDGYAVHAKDTYGAKETLPVLLFLDGEIMVGEETKMPLKEGYARYVSTGAMIPEGSDSVVMQEYVRRIEDMIEITRPVRKWENIIFKGEDIKRGDIFLKRGERITPFHLGILSALGISQIEVYKKPLISYLSTGDEIVSIDEIPPLGKVRDVNRYTIEGILKREEVETKFLGIVKDRKDEICEKLSSALSSDMIIVSGGSSKGERDLISQAIIELGGEIIFHGINIKPGKPTIFGQIGGKPVFGLPGHPLSCIMVTLRFVLPFVKRMKGEISSTVKTLRGILSENIPSSLGIEDYVCVKVKKEEGKCIAFPIFSKSSAISFLISACGFIIIPEEKEGLEKGEEVDIHPFHG